VHLRNDRYVGSALGRFDRGSHAREPTADDYDIVLDQAWRPL
jgi:hypothetical protein